MYNYEIFRTIRRIHVEHGNGLQARQLPPRAKGQRVQIADPGCTGLQEAHVGHRK